MLIKNCHAQHTVMSASPSALYHNTSKYLTKTSHKDTRAFLNSQARYKHTPLNEYVSEGPLCIPLQLLFAQCSIHILVQSQKCICIPTPNPQQSHPQYAPIIRVLWGDGNILPFCTVAWIPLYSLLPSLKYFPVGNKDYIEE
jgi:hypothetical protein